MTSRAEIAVFVRGATKESLIDFTELNWDFQLVSYLV